MRSAACTFTPSATTPTAAPPPDLTVRLPPLLKHKRGPGADSRTTDNPHNKTHGAPSDEERHVGDLGNIKTDAQGNAKDTVQDKFIKLIGPESVVGVS